LDFALPALQLIHIFLIIAGASSSVLPQRVRIHCAAAASPVISRRKKKMRKSEEKEKMMQ
jgi:hypothetical protein